MSSSLPSYGGSPISATRQLPRSMARCSSSTGDGTLDGSGPAVLSFASLQLGECQSARGRVRGRHPIRLRVLSRRKRRTNGSSSCSRTFAPVSPPAGKPRHRSKAVSPARRSHWKRPASPEEKSPTTRKPSTRCGQRMNARNRSVPQPARKHMDYRREDGRRLHS